MKKGTKKIALIIISIVAVIALTGSTLAWYTSRNSLSGVGSLVGFKTTAQVSFVNADGEQTPAKSDKNGLYRLSLDPAAENYVGNLRVKVIHRGYGKSYVRVKITPQWLMPDGSVAQNVVIPYTFADKWYDNRSSDGYVYYTENTGLFEEYNKSIITGFDSQLFSQTTMTDSSTLSVAIKAESVQANRYSQIWGIGALPWSK